MRKKTDSRRERARVPYEKNVVINGSLRVKAIDISEGGLYLHTGRSFPPGSTVTVEFPLFHDSLRVQAEVRYSHDGVGMGLKFRNLSDKQQELVKRYVEHSFLEDETAAGSKKKILIISDNAIGLKMYQSELTLKQFSVLQAKTVEEAEELVSHLHVDVILIALDMERPANFKLLRYLKASPSCDGIPILVVSPASRVTTRKHVCEAGASVFLEKITAAPQKVVQEVAKLYRKSPK